ncbi:gamma-D-glutamyl-L-diamino acid endopeptidase I [Pseudooceanicola batsensis HTCC2597]|uniref:Gamma-D-glutamyl-L-diamino acid endopeptidase I n=1 Tax=Pseudooceanicola batsensis (strain ATCC BAA-863 / DSM 15984 / KCTC 12145 / HTCC2597) TaxID=252305 RepID=A3TVW4_PSEBH|nr:DUF5818 domain-containing protein [Pseudooceanicola batsensis]EAQ03760.1 gamma-D-glutamyl-L-diamino acid endopeptidase I [Pseudooceanicola batsensis HTCC2597]
MSNPFHPKSALRLGAAALIATAGLATVASAQSRCGQSYTIQPGDTLYRVSQQCRVSLARIMDLNPSLGDPRDISVGTRLQLVSGAGQNGAPPRDRGDQYRVESGDTLAEVAERFGVSLFELISENDDVNPFALAVGELLDIPGDGPAASIGLSTDNGPPGSRVTIDARNLRPSDYVTIGVGPQASEWEALREARVDGDGRLSADLRVPEWSEPGDDLIFVVDTDRGLTLKSGVFDVTRSEPLPRTVTLEGRVDEGTECPVLRTRDGDRYALTSRSVGITPGEYVRIEGRRADMAFCMNGVDTVRVTEIEEVAPPRDDAGESDGMRVEGRVRDGVECPLLVTPDGDHYALASDRGVTVGEYVEVRGTRAEMSFCQQGQATITVDSIREVSPPARDRDPDRDGGIRLDAAYLAGPWAAKGGDCSRPDFDITRTGSSGLVIETSLDGAPRTGYVALGDDPAFIFDQPRREFPLESRGPDGVAVMAPDQGAVSLGGRTIRGDGRVFIQC